MANFMDSFMSALRGPQTSSPATPALPTSTSGSVAPSLPQGQTSAVMTVDSSATANLLDKLNTIQNNPNATIEDTFEAFDEWAVAIGDPTLQQRLVDVRESLAGVPSNVAEPMVNNLATLFIHAGQKSQEQQADNVAAIRRAYENIRDKELDLQMSEKGMMASVSGLLQIAGQLFTSFGRGDIGASLLSAAESLKPEIDTTYLNRFKDNMATVDTKIEAQIATGSFANEVSTWLSSMDTTAKGLAGAFRSQDPAPPVTGSAVPPPQPAPVLELQGNF